jgi:hypothetical protein
MTVELLYFEGCPHYAAVEHGLRSLLREAGLPEEIAMRNIASEEDAQRLRFLGSPTVRLDGRDIEPGAEDRTDTGLKCRLYRTPRGLEGVPDEALLRQALDGSLAT